MREHDWEKKGCFSLPYDGLAEKGFKCEKIVAFHKQACAELRRSIVAAGIAHR